MKTLFATALLLSFSFIGIAQKSNKAFYQATDQKILKIPSVMWRSTDSVASFIRQNFFGEDQQARAAFIWTAAAIDYDVANMYAMDFYAKPEDMISKTLMTGRGICGDYAAVFTDICKKVGLKSYVITGFTRQNGKADFIPHAWSGTRIDSTWYLFDPTWSAGYVNNHAFVRSLNDKYFKVPAEKMIKSHMPFDYMWQFLNYPITSQEFYEDRINKSVVKPLFSFSDTIATYEGLDSIAKLKAQAVRVEANGVKNSMIFDHLRHLKMTIENHRRNSAVSLYNQAVAEQAEGVESYNEYVNFKNRQFTPARPDAEIQAMIDIAITKLTNAKTKLNSIHEPDAEIANLMVKLSDSIDNLASSVREQRDWLKKYFSKNKLVRKTMFYEIKPGFRR